MDAGVEVREMFDIACAESEEFTRCIFPPESPNFKSSVKTLIAATKPTIYTLLQLLALALDLEDDQYFINLHRNVDDPTTASYTQLRTLLYPPISTQNENTAAKTEVVRCAEHTDYGTVTLLFQDSMGGLEVCRDITVLTF